MGNKPGGGGAAVSLLCAAAPDPLRGTHQHENGVRGVGYGSEVI